MDVERKRAAVARSSALPLESTDATLIQMDRTVWIIISIVAIAVAGFFGYRTYSDSASRKAEQSKAAEMDRQLKESQRQAKEAQRQLDQAAEAQRLAELNGAQKKEAESRQLAQAQAEREAQEMQRKQYEEKASKAAQDLERMKSEKGQLEAEARRLSELRTREANDAQAKLAAAQKALEETERQKNAEIERQAALIASYSRQPSQGPTAPTSTEASRAATSPGARIIYPWDYKRTSHYNLLMLPAPDESHQKP